MKKITFLIIIILNLNFTNSYSNNELYEKIDLFGEVLEKIKEDFVDDVLAVGKAAPASNWIMAWKSLR